MDSNMDASLYIHNSDDINDHINLIKDLEDKKIQKETSLKNINKNNSKIDKTESFIDVSTNILDYLEKYDKIHSKNLEKDKKI